MIEFQHASTTALPAHPVAPARRGRRSTSTAFARPGIPSCCDADDGAVEPNAGRDERSDRAWRSRAALVTESSIVSPGHRVGDEPPHQQPRDVALPSGK